MHGWVLLDMLMVRPHGFMLRGTAPWEAGVIIMGRLLFVSAGQDACDN